MLAYFNPSVNPMTIGFNKLREYTHIRFTWSRVAEIEVYGNI